VITSYQYIRVIVFSRVIDWLMIDTADCSAEAAEVGIPRIRKQTSSPRSIWHIPHWWAHYTLSAVSSRKTFLQTETVGDCTAVCLAVLVVVLLGSNGYPASNILLQLPDHRYGNVVTTVLQMVIRSTKYLTVCFFLSGPISSETPSRTMAKFCTQMHTTICKTSTGFYV